MKLDGVAGAADGLSDVTPVIDDCLLCTVLDRLMCTIRTHKTVTSRFWCWLQFKRLKNCFIVPFSLGRSFWHNEGRHCQILAWA